ncbi:MAG TPA: ABC transporter ATP-binding protein [bacterium]|nr:ABC transporter ATP-binding protein [bacterium]HPS29276.1 ABC transporter ATP-binding protein [bacterium]
MQKEIVNFNKVGFSYGRNEVLEAVDFTVEKGDFFAIIGPNGGGKTTILRLILGLENPTTGSISVGGTAPSKTALKTGYVPQFSNHDRQFPLSVKDVVLQGLMDPLSFFPFYKNEQLEKVHSIMKKLGIEKRALDRFGELSGGLKQRTLIARAIVSEPELLLLDEPVASVDSSVEKDIYEMLVELNKTMTIVMVSHDLGFVSDYVNRVGCVNRTFVSHHAHDISHHDIDSLYHSKGVIINHKCGI